MKLGFLKNLQTSKSSRINLTKFGGYNHTYTVGANEFYDERNLSSDFFPAISPRQKGAKIRTFVKPNGVYAKEEIAWVDGTHFYYAGNYIGEVEDSEKTFISMGAYLVIFPDKVVYNTDNGDFEPLEAHYQSIGNVTYSISKQDGTDYGTYVTSVTEPQDPADGDLWMDISGETPSLKQFSSASGTWFSIATTYVKISATGLGGNFGAYDGVTISGSELEYFNQDFIIYAKGEDWITVTGILSENYIQGSTLHIDRTVPDMDFYTECDNRIWGCSSEKHEIYACKQGDPKNWRVYMGIASDSYAVTVGTDGDFTGAVTHLGYVLFFKEDCIHKLYGTKPANYQMIQSHVRGVEKGSERSLCVVNETLFYKSKTGICVYSGALPSDISQPLGNVKYRNAAGGNFRGKYYVAMDYDVRGETERAVFCYDSEKSVWHRENDRNIQCFATCHNDLYYIADDTLFNIGGNVEYYSVEGETEVEKDIDWNFVSGNLAKGSPDLKYLSRVQMRVEVPYECFLRVWVLSYEGEHNLRYEDAVFIGKSGIVTIPILTPRSDYIALYAEGHGDIKIIEMSEYVTMGSDING